MRMIRTTRFTDSQIEYRVELIDKSKIKEGERVSCKTWNIWADNIVDATWQAGGLLRSYCRKLDNIERFSVLIQCPAVSQE
jgi:hypothetical protein